MLQLAMVGTITGRYVDFTTAQRGALEMLARRLGIDLGPDATDGVVGAMRRLPGHPDVRGGLETLRSQGHRLVALTNSPLDVARDQLAHAQVAQLFDLVLSAGEVRRLKPAREAYAHAADHARVGLEQLWMVAAHAWDVSGALTAGCHAIFVARPGQVPSPIGPEPDLVLPDIEALASALAG
jgi:2-haloacid dehalogenase